MIVAIRNRRIPKRIETFPDSSSLASTFKCEALSVDANTADPVWRISRIVELGGSRVETLFAGRGIFEHICDDREDPGLFPALPFINIISTLWSGVSGEARTFDGSGNLSFERTQAFTMAAWVKPLSTVTMSIFSKQDSPTTVRGYAFLLNAGKLQLDLRNNNPTDNRMVARTDAAISNNEWTHVVVTYDGSSDANNVKFYINGAVASFSIVVNTLTDTIINAIRFRIGRRNDGSLPFNGNIDQAGIFFAEFTALEVAELFSAGTPEAFADHSQSATLQGAWRMGDAQLFPVIPDQSGFSNDLTILNEAASVFVNDPAVVV